MTFKKLPLESSKNKNTEILGRWVYNQNKKYKLKSGLMKNKEIYDTWTQFMSNNPEYF